MSRSSIWNEEEREFLSTFATEYSNAGSDKQTFYGYVWGLYLRKFPVMPTEEEKAACGGDWKKALSLGSCAERRARRLALVYWYQNNGKRLALSANPALVPPPRVRMLDLSNKERRKPQPCHAWLRLFYDKPEVRAKFEAAWEAAKTAGWSNKKMVSFRNKWAGDKLQVADAETLAAVNTYREKGYLKDDAQRYIDVDPEDDDEMVHAKQIQEYLDNLPHTLTRVAESLHKQTGWFFSITCGGPLPRANGDLNTLHHSIGKCKQGLEWASWNSDQKTNIANFRQFLDASFSA
ncbi:hypothetical protein PUNSTDRAFT_136920 [Punctularia strigosozonata HHB-11173 SS5]|uniref:uncharacterized protein n=1 Tax=Punctularia strigosozonata (strain HHB-11173) TaxID=741275 RepID=UPI0004417B98|nr:uncharacterized protein PUNSTDRAFT_136920 [Punctularia strigosozonata HHB-11173 SS5]EIN06129.1 hypothetical protein PUNSTDRAFT_136920 [Punctularia strigosozonata HHB-11173 SS5]